MCGHPRVPDNMLKWGSTTDNGSKRNNVKCRTCRDLKRQGKPVPGKVVFHCGHPRDAENSLPSGTKNGKRQVRCKTCTYRRQGYPSYVAPLTVPNAVAIGVEYIMGDKPKVVKVAKAPKVPIRKLAQFKLQYVWGRSFLTPSVDNHPQTVT